MKQFRALLWKEWREDHVYLWIGLGVLLVLPLINAWQEIYYLRHFELHASEWILLLGGIFAVVVSVGVSCRDLSEPLEDFWRSRPVAIGRWMLTKYAAGALIVLICCVLPAIVELFLGETKLPPLLIVWFPFLWIAIFSIGFLVGCLLRKSAQTSLIAIGAMLLLYILPIVLPPLRWLSISAIDSLPTGAMDQSGSKPLHPWAWLWAKPLLHFAVGMLFLAIVCTVLAVVAVGRDWRISVGRKTMFGSVAAAFLLLLSTAAFQLGTNMPILQTISVPEGAWMGAQFGASDDKATFMAGQTLEPDAASESGFRPIELYQDVTANSQGMQLSAPYVMDSHYFASNGPTSPIRPDIRYFVSEDPNRLKYVLHVAETSNGTESRVPLRDMVFDKDGREISWQRTLQILHNRLYIPGDQLLVMDISQPQSPKIISKTPYSALQWAGGGGGLFVRAIPPAPGLSEMEELQLCGVQVEDGLFVYTGAGAESNRLVLYRLESLAHHEARFVQIAERRPSGLEAFLGGHYDDVVLKAGKVYVLCGGRSSINGSITVYSATGPRPLEPIGHFGAPSIIGFCPLSDGRCIVAGRDQNHWPAAKLWLLGPPPQHD